MLIITFSAFAVFIFVMMVMTDSKDAAYRERLAQKEREEKFRETMWKTCEKQSMEHMKWQDSLLEWEMKKAAAKRMLIIEHPRNADDCCVLWPPKVRKMVDGDLA